jgi:hypothetical protein
MPQMLTRTSPLGASVGLGLLWALWHVPLLYIPGASSIGSAWPAFFLAVVPLTTLFTFVHLHAGGSVLLAILLHNSVNLSSEGLPLSVTDWGAVALLWAVAALIVGLRWRRWTALPGSERSPAQAA